MPRWQAELHKWNRDVSHERNRFTALVAQTTHELETLTVFVQGNAQRVVIDQQSALIGKCLGRIEQILADDPSLADLITNNLIHAALEKRAARRELASRELESQNHNARQLEWNTLLARASRDVDLVQSFVGVSRLDAAFNKTLGRRMKETAIAMLALVRSEDAGTIDMSGMSQTTQDWFQRTTRLLDQEQLKESKP